MVTPLVSPAAAALRRGFLVLALLAVVSGFLGMHILGGLHGAKTVTAVTSEADAGPLGSGELAAQPGPCECQPSCTDPAPAHSACVPSSPVVTSLAAPPPGTTSISIHAIPTPGAGKVSAYSYRPASPSPGDLSVSRT